MKGSAHWRRLAITLVSVLGPAFVLGLTLTALLSSPMPGEAPRPTAAVELGQPSPTALAELSTLSPNAQVSALPSAAATSSPPPQSAMAPTATRQSAPRTPAAPAIPVVPAPRPVSAAAMPACVGPALPAVGAGQFRAPTGQLVAPVGQFTRLPSLPLAMAVSPNGRWAVTANNGQAPSISLVSLSPLAQQQTIVVKSVYLGAAFSPDGQSVYVATGGGQSVLVYRLQGDSSRLVPEGEIAVGGYPAGLAVSPRGQELYVAENLGSAVAVVDLGKRMVVAEVAVDPFPYAVATSPDGQSIYVTHWIGDSIAVVDVAGRRTKARIKVGTHPTGIAVSPDGARVLVANANSDTLSIVDARALAVVQTLGLAPYAGARHGSSPDSVAVSPDGARAFVTLPGNNAVAVVARSGQGPGATYRVEGLVPTGWYPSAVAATPNGPRLVVLAAKGLGRGPTEVPAPTFPGGLQVLPLPSDAELPGLTRQVLANNLLVSSDGAQPQPAVVCPEVPWLRQRVKYVVYILKENRSFDQVLGDLPGVDGEPALAAFGQKVTPNHHALAEQFAVADRFFVDGEVSAQGHTWATSSDTTDYLEKTWPQYYYRRGRAWDVGTDASRPPEGTIFDAVSAAHISLRVYGNIYSAAEGASPEAQVERRSPTYPPFNLSVPDQRRADAFLAEFAGYETTGQLPTFIYLWLPNDHTAGPQKGYHTPRAMVADNDLALGRILERLSHSRFWPEMAVFIAEDDAQGGPDHVDSHRSVLIAAGGPIRRGYVSHNHYDQASLARTVELILGLAPLTQFDRLAAPMLDLFSDAPNPQPYTALPAQVSLDEVNGGTAEIPAGVVNLAEADDMDDEAFAAIVWESATGTPYGHALEIVARARAGAAGLGSDLQ